MKKTKWMWLGLGGLGLTALAVILAAPQSSENQPGGLWAGRNVNMVSGQKLPNGDPFLQRQNEPSLAVSTRNPLHILAGANDYRTVDMDIETADEELPARPPAQPEPEPWLGLYKSFDGGESWLSGLLPGYPQETQEEQAAQGQASPLFGEYRAAADPVVRSGPNGMFYYAGLAFNRRQETPSPGAFSRGKERGGIFVARFIDDNNKERGDTIKYLDTRLVEEGSPGRFVDKPWLAVGLQESGPSVTVNGQSIPAHNVYLVYAVFRGQGQSGPRSQIWFHRSTDCGLSWEPNARLLSEGEPVNQGVTIAVDPRGNGVLYVAWRGFEANRPAIFICRSADHGASFSRPHKIAEIKPFDQGSTGTSFRTNSYPSIAVDSQGIVYAVWSGRLAPPFPYFLFKKGRAVIWISTSDPASPGSDGDMVWSVPQPLETPLPGGTDAQKLGHQFMPSVTYAAGRLVAAWYDQRKDRSSQRGDWLSGIEHTIDVRAAQALPGTAPVFGAPLQVSRYLFYLDSRTGRSMARQLQYNYPNYPLFKKGTQPFIGDYIDLAPSPMFVPGGDGSWVFNTAPAASPVYHAAWTDNRDVRRPADGNWTSYQPPGSDQAANFGGPNPPALPERTGVRNQNVYTVRLTGGLVVGSVGNTKSLRTSFKRTFVVFVKNATGETRSFRLTIEIPPGSVMDASFLQFESLKTLDVTIPGRSSVSRTVFATTTTDHARPPFSIDVQEIDAPAGQPVAGGLQGEVLFNPDIENPDIENPDIENPVPQNPDIENAEVHNPDIENPDIENPDIENPEVYNPDIENPDIENPEIVNPDIENPDIENPDIENVDVVNPDIENPDIENVYPFVVTGEVRDKSWTIKNTGNSASAYTLKLINKGTVWRELFPVSYQLLIYKIHTTPVDVHGKLKMAHHDELLTSIVNPVIYAPDIENPDIENPDIENPDIENPDIENPDIENATLGLAPGEEARVTLRAYKKQGGPVYDWNLEKFEAVATPQAVNSEAEDDPHPVPAVASNYDTPRILNRVLKRATVRFANPQGNRYLEYLVAIGGTVPYTWRIISGQLPPGLSLDAQSGTIRGILNPLSFPVADQWYVYGFTAQVMDANGQRAKRSFSILIRRT